MGAIKKYFAKLLESSVEKYFEDESKYNESFEDSFKGVDNALTNFVDKKGNKVDMTLSQAVQDFNKTKISLQNEFDKTFGVAANKKNIITIQGRKFSLIVNPPEKEKARKPISDAMYQKIFDSTKRQYIENELMGKKFDELGFHPGGQVRNFEALFVPGREFKPEEEELKPENLLKFFKSDAPTIEKQNKFDAYIKLLAKDLQNCCTNFKDDEEFINNYDRITRAAWPFSIENINEFSATLEFEVLESTKNYFLEVRPYSQTISGIIDGRAEVMADPSYAKYDQKTATNLEDVFQEDMIQFASYNDAPLVPLEHAYLGVNCASEQQCPRTGTGDFYKDVFDLKGEDTFVGKDGYLFVSQVSAALENKERVEVIREGKHFTLSLDKDGMLKQSKDIIPAYDEETKKLYKNKFKACSEKLEANTAWYNASSPEYKKLRTKFKELAEKDFSKEEMSEKLKEIKQISDLYKENHYKKPKISALADKRKESVDFVADIAEEMIGALEIDSSLVKSALMSQKLDNERTRNLSEQIKRDTDSCVVANLSQKDIDNIMSNTNNMQYDKEAMGNQ